MAGWASRDNGQHWEQLPLAQPELHGAWESHGAEPEGTEMAMRSTHQAPSALTSVPQRALLSTGFN